MTAEELAKHRQKYWDELVRFMKGYRFGPRATLEDLEYLMSLISDSTIIQDVESGTPPIRTIEELVYYETQLPLSKK